MSNQEARTMFIKLGFKPSLEPIFNILCRAWLLRYSAEAKLPLPTQTVTDKRKFNDYILSFLTTYGSMLWPDKSDDEYPCHHLANFMGRGTTGFVYTRDKPGSDRADFDAAVYLMVDFEPVRVLRVLGAPLFLCLREYFGSVNDSCYDSTATNVEKLDLDRLALDFVSGTEKTLSEIP